MRHYLHNWWPVLLSVLFWPAGSNGQVPGSQKRASVDEVVSSLAEALRSGDFIRASTLFAPQVRSKLSPHELADMWRKYATDDLGSGLSWTIVGRTGIPRAEIREVEFVFEKGEKLLVVEVNVESGLIDVVPYFRDLEPFTPAPYVHRNRFQDFRVTVGREPFLLEGAFAVPRGAGPFPAVLLVQGGRTTWASPGGDRDGTVHWSKMTKDLAEGLASRGIATLRYDQRTFVYRDRLMAENRLTRGLTVDQEIVDDAVLAVASLRNRPEVDKTRIFVVGHSLGALLAPEIATRADPIAGMVVLAPMGRPPWDWLAREARRWLEKGFGKDEWVAQTERGAALLDAGRLGDANLFVGHDQAYWKDLARRDGIAVARRLRHPVLVIGCDRDDSTTARDIRPWRTGVQVIPGSAVETVPGCNHFLMPAGPVLIAPNHVDPKVIDRITAFIQSTSIRPHRR